MGELLERFAALSPEKRAMLFKQLNRSRSGAAQSGIVAQKRDSNVFPLSFAQTRLWFVEQFAPGSSVYNIPTAFRVKGELKVEMVEECLNHLVSRHETLRTTFSSIQQSPLQIIYDSLPVKLDLFDLSRLDPSDRDRELRRLAGEEAARPFDLTRGPLLRASLIKLDRQEHALVLVMHHIVSDGWSAGILIKELGELYQANVEGRASRLSELAIQYADYAVWQRQWLQGEALDSQLAFWKEELKGSAGVLRLPADRPRPAMRSFRGGRESFHISPALKESLEALSLQEGATLFMTLLSAYQALLWRYTGQDDINVGTPVAGRSLAETEGLIGFFVNTLVIRGLLSDDPTFRQFLKRMREVTLRALGRQELPFQNLVEALQPERSLSHTPLAQVTFTLQNAPQEAIRLPGLTLEPMEIDSGKAEYDLSMIMWPEAEGLSGALVYSADIFEPGTIKQFANHFQRLLEQIASNPDQRISLLPLLTNEEREEILVGWNNTDRPYPLDLTVHALFEHQASLYPDGVALICRDRAITYGQLNRRANQLAHYLLQLGVGPDLAVAIALERSEQTVIAMLAALKAGGAYVAIDTSYPLERISYMLADGQVGVIVTDRDGAEKLPAGWAQVVCVDEDQEVIASCNSQNPAVNVTAENAAYISYTSGSTGEPKGVVVCHGAILRLLMGVDYTGLGRDRTLLHLSPLAFDASTFEIWGALLHGGRCVLLPEKVPTPQTLDRIIKRHGVDTTWLTASLFNLVIDEAPEALSSVEQLLIGGEALSLPHVCRALESLPATKLVNGYGPTEGTTFTCCYVIPRDFDGSRGSIPIGKPIANTKVYLLDRRLNPVPAGVPGELYIGGDGLARGYLNKPGLTAENFIPDPFSRKSGARLYRTGDQTRYRPDGAIEFIGRLDTQVKVRGFRIELSEIEIALARHPAIKQAVAEVWKDGPADKRIVAYLVAAERLQPSVGELRGYLAGRLPEYMLPAAFVWLDALPLLESGKVDRRSLPAPERLRADVEEAFTAPRTQNEKILAEIWAEVLGLEQVGVRGNFFDLGGDSIRSIQVVAKSNERSLNISLQQIFQHPTIEGLARSLYEGANTLSTWRSLSPFSLISEQDRRRIPEGIEDAYPVTRLQAGMLFHSEYSPESAVYHDIFSFHMKSPLDAEAMRSTIQLMIERHAILRSSFDLHGFSEPLQLVNRAVEEPLEVHDLSHLPSERQDEVLQARFEAEKKRDFHWNKAPLLRVEVYRRAERSFQLIVSFHHAILDGWSFSTLLAEMFHHYLFLLGKESRGLAPPPEQGFRDFVRLERQAIESEESRRFWSAKLADVSPIRLPRWPAGKSPRTRRISSIDTLLSKETVKGLNSVAASLGAPLKSVLLAVHFRALGRLSGQDDIVAGVVTHGRPEEVDGERILGLFLNTLPFRLTLTSGTWNDLAQQTFELEREILPHRRYPLADLQRMSGDRALFEVLFDFTHFHVYRGLPQSEEFEVLSAQSVAETNFTLVVHFNLDPFSSELRLTLIYDESQMCAEQAKSMADCYDRALAAMASAPSSMHDLLLPFSEEEREEILVGWNDTDRPYPLGLTVHALFEHQASLYPDNVALVRHDQALTYDQLNRRANQLAHHLLRLGVGPDLPVAIALERGEQTVIAILAALKAGGAYVAIDTSYPLERLNYMLAEGQVGVIVMDREGADRLPAVWAQVVCIDEDWEVIASCSSQNPAVNLTANNLAYVIYTSGSTGTPKGVMVEHGGVVNLAGWQAETFNVTNQSRILQFFSYSFDGAVGETFMALLNGATLVMADRENLDPARLAQVINEQRISVAVLVPSLIKQLDPDRFERPDEVQIVSVGEACPSEMALRWANRCRFINAYGPTEYTVYSHLWRATEAGIRENNCVPIGKPIHNTKTFILDKRLMPAPVGAPGEIYISGAGLARGYLNQPEETAARLLPNPFNHNNQYRDHGTLSLDSAVRQIAGFIENHAGSARVRASRAEEINKLTPYFILKLIECLDADLVEKTRSIISDYGDNSAVYDCFVRYFLEGAKDEYASCGVNEELLKFLLFEDFRGMKGVDFCFGNAEILQSLAGMGACVKGVDFSPFFVQRARNRRLDVYMARADVPFDQLSKECGIEEASQDFALTTLSLDRVGNPNNLLRNMLACLKENGRFSIQTLLPIISIDDGKVDAPITYTPEQNRLTSGASADRDKNELITLLCEMGAYDLNICRAPYVVASTDGVQEYVMWSFFGAKRPSRSSVIYNNTYSRMYRTGDLGRYLPGGDIEFLGRSDYQVKIRGFRLELEGIEAAIEQHPAVRQAVVMAKEFGAGDIRLAAYLAPEPGSDCSLDELRAFIKDRLPDYMWPSSFALIDSLPTTQSGKIDRRALAALDGRALTLETPFTPPRTMIEEVLAGVFAQTLGLQRVGVHDNFFDMGGHSLLATQVISRIRAALHVELPLRSLFDGPTVAELAQVIEESDGRHQDRNAPPLEPVSIRRDLPLSFAQERLWFLDQLEPGSSTYNVAAAVRLAGTVDLAALEDSLNDIIARHESLRTTFCMIDGAPFQMIHPQAPLTLKVDDLALLPEADREFELERLINLEAQEPFDLQHGPLLRVKLLRLAELEHVALIAMSHIVSDGWSMGVLIDEIAALYEAHINGQSPNLPDLPVQYADYAVWQRGWLKGDVLETQLAYWNRRLAGAPAVLQLPTDRPRPPIQTHRGGFLSHTLSRQLTADLELISRSEGATLFMTLLAAFNVLLYKYSGQENILVGTPVANRNRREIEGLIGFFVNTLVIRTDLSGDPTFRQLLARARQTAIEAFDHQDVPFEKVVDELKLDRDMSRNPLFQVMFALQNAPARKLDWPGLRLEELPLETKTARFDLTLIAEKVGDHLRASVEYSSDLFDDATIKRMLNHLEKLLEAIVAGPDQHISDLSVLTQSEHEQILRLWNDMAVAYDRHACIHELFEAQVARGPDSVALSFQGQELTYFELNRRANRLAHYLRGLHVGPESLVAVCLDRSPEMVVALLGILKAGAAYVPLDPTYPKDRLALMLEDANPAVVVTRQDLLDALPKTHTSVVCLDSDQESIASSSDENPPVEVSGDNLAYVIYTSGSTGAPKGTLVTRSNVTRLLAATQRWFNFDESDVWTLFHSYAFDFSVWELWGALAYGGRLVVTPYLTSRSPDDFYESLLDEQVTVLNQTPSAFRQLIRAEEAAPSAAQLNLRLVIFGGEALDLQSLRPWFDRHGDRQPRLVNMYGITETTVHVTYRPINEADLRRACGSVIGEPIPDLQICILDRHMRPAPIGVAGEIYVGGDGLARGYHDRPGMTAERFIPHPFTAKHGARLYRSGDVGRLLPDGDIEYLGRADHQVKIRGFRIELGEIEATLMRYPGVREAVAMVWEDSIPREPGEKKLVAYVVGRDSSPVSAGELREYLKEKLPDYMRPSAIVMLDALPLNPNGKIDRRALPGAESAAPERSGFIAPRDLLEMRLARIWEDALGAPPIGVKDNFFDLGGHSLLAVRLTARIEKEFNVKVPLASLFQGATVEDLARILYAPEKFASSLVPIRAGASRPPLFFIHPVGGNVIAYATLARRLPSDQPLYGLQSRGLFDQQETRASIEDMAADYIEAILEVQSHGPYFLAGWSMGGVIAFEMARQLEARGERTALLALLDSWLQVTTEDAEQEEEAASLAAFAREIGLAPDDFAELWPQVKHRSRDERLISLYEHATSRDLLPDAIGLEKLRSLLRVFEVNTRAMLSYAPKPFSGRIILFQATESLSRAGDDETSSWGELARQGVDLHSVAGDHYSIIREPAVKHIADVLMMKINHIASRRLDKE